MQYYIRHYMVINVDVRCIYSMHVLPRCHKTGIWEHAASVDFHINYGMVDIPDSSKVTIVIMVHSRIHYNNVGGADNIVTR